MGFSSSYRFGFSDKLVVTTRGLRKFWHAPLNRARPPASPRLRVLTKDPSRWIKRPRSRMAAARISGPPRSQFQERIIIRSNGNPLAASEFSETARKLLNLFGIPIGIRAPL
jgi:ABC-type phosphate transport system auxiliary subunit